MCDLSLTLGLWGLCWKVVWDFGRCSLESGGRTLEGQVLERGSSIAYNAIKSTFQIDHFLQGNELGCLEMNCNNGRPSGAPWWLANPIWHILVSLVCTPLIFFTLCIMGKVYRESCEPEEIVYWSNPLLPGWLNEHPTFQLVQKKELPASKGSIEIWGNKGGNLTLEKPTLSMWKRWSIVKEGDASSSEQVLGSKQLYTDVAFCIQ